MTAASDDSCLGWGALPREWGEGVETADEGGGDGGLIRHDAAFRRRHHRSTQHPEHHPPQQGSGSGHKGDLPNFSQESRAEHPVTIRAEASAAVGLKSASGQGLAAAETDLSCHRVDWFCSDRQVGVN